MTETRKFDRRAWARERYKNLSEEERAKQVAQTKAWRKKNPEKRKQHFQTAYAKNKEKMNEASLAWQQANPEKKKAMQRKVRLKKFGITIEEYDRMFIQQKGCCASCETHQDQCERTLAVDHCHATGKVRGLLCFNCNAALGLLKDNIDTICKLATYLQKEREPNLAPLT